MNSYIDSQILNMIAMIRVFEQSCQSAATKDDGKISRDEEKQLKKIKIASQKFIKELENIR
ncbi:hypothetical protein [Intestinimonas sp. HCP28S3_D6]|uniref:hypothetical protein n=1 Tax=Intestinimonas sp. HCP28S3_D6 TaxID=3438942 RepID=UPI003F895F25